jgi:hypothetical protein
MGTNGPSSMPGSGEGSSGRIDRDSHATKDCVSPERDATMQPMVAYFNLNSPPTLEASS